MGSALDRGIGIVLGILLGVAIVTAFVFLGSEETIDAPRISGVESGGGPARGGRDEDRLPLVRVEGGAPPPSGPARLDIARGERVRFEVITDIPITIEIPGYGIREAIDAGDTTVSFKAFKSGQFPVIVADSSIAIATLRVGRPGGAP